jgi:SAM-dependent methyltransferase
MSLNDIMEFSEIIKSVFKEPVEINENIITLSQGVESIETNQQQTEDIFSDKWSEASKYESIEKLYTFQFDWFLKLYGFETEENLKKILATKKVIIDTGCGLGYKAAWFARLAPHALVLGVDISESIYIASQNFSDLPNLFFFRADIANTGLKQNVIDFTVCDQVIMHTEDPALTFKHLTDITSIQGEFACYVYSKKALPRELIDDYFRKETHQIPKEKMWEFSKQLTELGKVLSELNVTFDCPDIPVLGIKGGNYDIQRFIYWNFLKCFWRDEWGFDLSLSTNYDWYAPSNAKRYSKEEFENMINSNDLKIVHFHQEEACYSGRFLKK